jgi:hypothetical protein
LKWVACREIRSSCQVAPFGDPLYLDINGSHLAIRIETAKEIEELIKINLNDQPKYQSL